MKRIGVFTGSRSDYDILYPVISELDKSEHLEYRLIASGSHLNQNFGQTEQKIYDDGFTVHSKITMPKIGYRDQDIVISSGEALKSLGQELSSLNLDIIIILGDRFEALIAATAALFLRIPILHLCGGDLTLGSVDESTRHAISKMAHFHCVTNELSKKILLQLGEEPSRIWVTGSPALDNIAKFEPMEKKLFFDALKIDTKRPVALIAFHPENRGNLDFEANELLMALEHLSKNEIFVLLTGANADAGGIALNKKFNDFCLKNQNAKFVISLGRELFYNALNHSDILIGNSSSAIYEGPSFGIPTVNIGSRQTGRIFASNIHNSLNIKDEIVRHTQIALSIGRKSTINHFGTGNASKLIIEILERLELKNFNMAKSFNCFQ